MLISSGCVRVNGRPSRKGEIIGAGDQVEVIPVIEAATSSSISNVILKILYQDENLLVVAKPALLPCHHLRPTHEETVITVLANDYPEVARIGEKAFEGGLIHRLDNGTSGALMVARTPTALEFMREALRRGHIFRRYEAFAEGKLESPIDLNWPIAHHRKNPARMVIADDAPLPANASRAQHIVRAPYRGKPREAFSRIEPIRNVDAFTLASVIPRTGRRHQIRVHLAGAGYPIANDELYGGPKSPRLPSGRFWLHLAELRFTSPTGEEVHVIASRPPDLEQTLALIKHRN